MSALGLRGGRHLPKQVRPLNQERRREPIVKPRTAYCHFGGPSPSDHCRGWHDIPVTEIFVPRWLLILSAIALIALIAGYVTFGGANMGR